MKTDQVTQLKRSRPNNRKFSVLSFDVGSRQLGGGGMLTLISIPSCQQHISNQRVDQNALKAIHNACNGDFIKIPCLMLNAIAYKTADDY